MPGEAAQQAPNEVLPQQLQDVLLLALAMVPESVMSAEGLELSQHQLLELLRLPAAGQLSTGALLSLINNALKV
jgi:hypothetical protein